MSMSAHRTLAAVGVLLLAVSPALALNIRAVDNDGKPVRGFRFLVQEDTTHNVIPGLRTPDTLSLSINRTYSPPVASGHVRGAGAAVRLPADRKYYVSILPDSGYANGGRQVDAGQRRVEVLVEKEPIPTALISVFAFHDNQPINGAPDLPEELGLEGFTVTVHDYLGQVMPDAFGNMIGTTYLKNPDDTFILDADGAPIVDVPGDGIVRTNADGEALIKYLSPNNYTVEVSPPSGSGWVQTASLEGTTANDVWVKAAEPRFPTANGTLNWLIFFGFVQAEEFPASAGPTSDITGQVVYTHDYPPPMSPGLVPGRPVENAWVGLNNLGGNDEQVYSAPCDPATGAFTIPNVPPGSYQLVMWDRPIDAIIDFRTVNVPDTGEDIDMGQVPVFAWFGHVEGHVFEDYNENGFRDPGEPGIPQQVVNVRFLDGTIYKSTFTDGAGYYHLSELFPFMRWVIVEVDYARYKATGMTTWVDAGGPLPGAGVPYGTLLNPQLQVDENGTPIINPNTGDNTCRTETGPSLLEAMILYAGQTNVIDWGKKPYEPGETGQIVGITYYANTRAENDPRLAVGEQWEPGVPRVQVNLYADGDVDREPLGNFPGLEDTDWNGDGVQDRPDGIIDDLNGDGKVTLADVDNYPFGWRDGGRRGPEDVRRAPGNVFDPGDAVAIVTSDSWDDNPPDFVGPTQYVTINGVQTPITRGAETLRTFNQVQPGVFDGGYAFNSYVPGGMASGAAPVQGLPSNCYYIVEAVAPPHYEHVKEEDKNVDFGMNFIPEDNGFEIGAANILPPNPTAPPLLVGDVRRVPDELSLFPGVPCYYAGQTRPLPDRKWFFLQEQTNANCDFFLFTPVPQAGRIWGWLTDDLQLEYNPSSLNMGSNFSPSWLPVALKDWRGFEVQRTYTDEWGRFDTLVPGSYTANVPCPTGFSANIVNIVPNDPGLIDPRNPAAFVPDPWYNPAYGTELWEHREFFPGRTTHVDVIVVPIAGFTANRTPLDCDFPDGSPLIYSVTGRERGPLVRQGARPAQRRITLRSAGATEVPNPDYDAANPGGQAATLTRDYGFGRQRGTVTVDGVELTINRWNDRIIVATVPDNVTESGQMMVTRGDNGITSPIGITLHVLPADAPVLHVAARQSIQDAIDAAPDGALILIEPGVYAENLFLYKPVMLQGAGAYSTIIQTYNFILSSDAQIAWVNKLQALIDSGDIVLVTGGQVGFAGQEGAGITVASSPGRFAAMQSGLIDGMAMTGALDTGGAIYVNAYADYLRISNMRIMSNQGALGGGIRIGSPSLAPVGGLEPVEPDPEAEPFTTFVSSPNPSIWIHHNHIAMNGASLGSGGGIAIYKGADNYQITDNFLCGNHALVYGGAIAHFGYSPGGVIARNVIVNNESTDEGGGIMLAGEGLPANVVGGLSEGAGSVEGRGQPHPGQQGRRRRRRREDAQLQRAGRPGKRRRPAGRGARLNSSTT